MAGRIRRTMVGNDTDGVIYKVDTIEHEGKLWLVPHWLETPAEGLKRPARLIRMDTLPHQDVPAGSSYGVEFVLSGPIPKSLLDFSVPRTPTPEFELRELPDLPSFPIGQKWN